MNYLPVEILFSIGGICNLIDLIAFSSCNKSTSVLRPTISKHLLKYNWGSIVDQEYINHKGYHHTKSCYKLGANKVLYKYKIIGPGQHTHYFLVLTGSKAYYIAQFDMYRCYINRLRFGSIYDLSNYLCDDKFLKTIKCLPNKLEKQIQHYYTAVNNYTIKLSTQIVPKPCEYNTIYIGQAMNDCVPFGLVCAAYGSQVHFDSNYLTDNQIALIQENIEFNEFNYVTLGPGIKQLYYDYVIDDNNPEQFTQYPSQPTIRSDTFKPTRDNQYIGSLIYRHILKSDLATQKFYLKDYNYLKGVYEQYGCDIPSELLS